MVILGGSPRVKLLMVRTIPSLSSSLYFHHFLMVESGIHVVVVVGDGDDVVDNSFFF